ncbi:taurine catabolism dioxygenase TauD [Sulfuricella sp. T08]|uniref:TauD/TfdA dioxygenase family protein n=1 Tax=Sulfuricella sp. T08 TaxID=1632857 RepID=UPI0006179DE6|nr:TauD/TfdA family dioxygenase [Sulfuricella sp. T08]GAO35209.1 taurine catabolism dioxygenase TauD [Sulfuricella sp. T08]
MQSPFLLENESAYQAWRNRKLEGYPTRLDQIVVEINDPRSLTQSEYQAILQICQKTNMAVYASKTGTDPDKDIPRLLGKRYGLERLDCNMLADDDGLTSLKVVENSPRHGFIPYSNKPIKWHTDGYYNTLEHQIWGLQLHCVQSSAEGGENALLDHEIAYLLMRDENPDFIRALMQSDAMTIPARVEEDGVARPDAVGPVFSVHPESGDLHMRYTARTRSIVWKQDDLTLAAVAFLEKLHASDLPFIYRGRLEPGMGLVSNNVLHDRAGFNDTPDQKRLLYRARYYDRISGTGVREVYGL